METEEQRAARVAAAEARRAARREEWRRFQEGRHHGIAAARAAERQLWASGAHRLTTSIRVRDLLRATFPPYRCGRCGRTARVEGMLPSHAAGAAERKVCPSCYGWSMLAVAYDPFGRETATPPWRTVGGVAYVETRAGVVELGVLPAPDDPQKEDDGIGEGVNEGHAFSGEGEE